MVSFGRNMKNFMMVYEMHIQNFADTKKGEKKMAKMAKMAYLWNYNNRFPLFFQQNSLRWLGSSYEKMSINE